MGLLSLSLRSIALCLLHGIVVFSRSRAQDQELVLVASSSFALDLSPTNTELLPESLRVIQRTMNSALQEAQKDNAGNTTIEYLSNKTKVVFPHVDYHPGNTSTSIRFFALATVSTISVPSGTSFRDYRLRSAESRKAALNELLIVILDSPTLFLDALIAEANSTYNSSVPQDVALTIAGQIQGIEDLSVRSVADPPSEPDPNIESVVSSNDLSSIDIVLIGVSIVVLASMLSIAFQVRRDRIGSTDAEPQFATGSTTNTAHRHDKRGSLETTDRIGARCNREIGEFKAGDSASSSIASIVFSDFTPSFKLTQQPSGHQAATSHLEDIELKKNHEVHVTGSVNSDSDADAHLNSLHGLDADNESGWSERNNLTSSEITGSDNSILSLTPLDSSSPLPSSGEPAISSFSALVDTLLLSNSQSFLFPSEAADATTLHREHRVKPFDIKVFHDDLSSSTSKSGHIFRNFSRTLSNASDDLFNGNATVKQGEQCVADWTKSICVVPSVAESTESKTSGNTSFSSITTPSSVELSMESSSVCSPKRKRRRHTKTSADEPEFAVV
jgi:hypothetical protein